MIDLHSHILPGIDDGARTLDVSLEMARIAVNDGITVMACTPHIYPGMYMNDGPGIAAHAARLQRALQEHGIALELVVGADVHLVPGLLAGLRSGAVPTLHGSRYFLLEPSHTTPPPALRRLGIRPHRLGLHAHHHPPRAADLGGTALPAVPEADPARRVDADHGWRPDGHVRTACKVLGRAFPQGRTYAPPGHRCPLDWPATAGSVGGRRDRRQSVGDDGSTEPRAAPSQCRAAEPSTRRFPFADGRIGAGICLGCRARRVEADWIVVNLQRANRY